MKIVGIVDIHGNTTHVPALAAQVPDADLLLLGGDLTNFGRGGDALAVLEALAPCAPRLLAVLGNCDYPEVRRTLADREVNLDRAGTSVGAVDLVGVGGSIACPGRTPNEYADAELGRFLDAAQAQLAGGRPVIMVSHQPPMDTIVDRVGGGSHAGSAAVRSFIEVQQPLVCLSGHIHEGDGIDRIGGTQLVNPGPFMHGNYAVIEVFAGAAEVTIHSLNT